MLPDSLPSVLAKLQPVVSDDGCWLVVPNNGNGYRRMRFEGRLSYAHRLAYESVKGPVPDGLELDHLCRIRACINPDHLEPVTRTENIRRGEGPSRLARVHGDKTHCVNGHPFNEENTYLRPTGGRACKTCRAQVARNHEANRKLERRQRRMSWPRSYTN